ncbi:hypothetical protein DUI87_01509 [Hirundo rustica rustica]|uniref:ribonuclease H n=1 Tax=Hirundo rustica rustica TaxID=333673 RepID=A0A3M0LNH7_HIRRU|nr:hypothetical protein DUI87_01509 [Hirundo rustica rustica]
MIRELESQGVVSKTHTPFNSPIWPVCKSGREWRLTVDSRALNKATPPLSAAVPDMLEIQYELESKAAKWYATIDIANTFFSIPLAAECRPQFAFTWKGMQYTWNRLPQGWKHSPHHLPWTDPGCTGKGKNDFHWGPKQQQAFAQMKQEIAHEVALGPVRTGTEVKNMLYSAAGSHGLSWSLWQKVTKATEGDGESSQPAELKAIQLALDIAKREKRPKLYLYTDSWMVANALWGWLDRWKKANWQHRGMLIWAENEWNDIATKVEKLAVKVCHADVHVP